MLQNINECYGNKLAAADGEIGHVKDFYFEDKTGVIRYLVADTGSWLTGENEVAEAGGGNPGAKNHLR